MRTLQTLTRNNPKVWIYCKDEQTQERFLSQAQEEGFKALDGRDPTDLSHHLFYGLNEDNTIGYVSNLIWSLSFNSPTAASPHIDYDKYISGEDDYICHTAIVRMISFDEWHRIDTDNNQE